MRLLAACFIAVWMSVLADGARGGDARWALAAGAMIGLNLWIVGATDGDADMNAET